MTEMILANEPVMRLAFFVGVFAVVTLWEWWGRCHIQPPPHLL